MASGKQKKESLGPSQILLRAVIWTLAVTLLLLRGELLVAAKWRSVNVLAPFAIGLLVGGATVLYWRWRPEAGQSTICNVIIVALWWAVVGIFRAFAPAYHEYAYFTGALVPLVMLIVFDMKDRAP
ncbi:MAG: hypothetical protein R6V19_14685 [Armatimonadota bacterium]